MNKEQLREYRKKYQSEHKKEIAANKKIYFLNHELEIKKYQAKYRKEHRNKNINYQKIYVQLNKNKILEQRKIYRKDNKNGIKLINKKYYELNKDKILKSQKEYYLKNLNKCRTRNSKYILNRLKIDMNFKLACNLRHRIYMALKGITKSASTAQLLGCSVEFFKRYYESKFKLGMSWDKVMSGEIHCDHIIPCASFDLSKPSEQHKCFHYMNLQPLWAIDNLKKSNKIIGGN